MLGACTEHSNAISNSIPYAPYVTTCSEPWKWHVGMPYMLGAWSIGTQVYEASECRCMEPRYAGVDAIRGRTEDPALRVNTQEHAASIYSPLVKLGHNIQGT